MPSATLSTVISRVLDEIYRDNLTAQATTALQSAIRHYERYPWWPKEERAYATLVAGQEYYALPDRFQKVDSFTVTVNGSTTPLTQRTFEQIDRWQESSATGTPTDFAIYDKQIRLFLIPDQSGTLNIAYSARLADLAGTDDNDWTNHAEELIRRRAEADLAFSILRDTEAYTGFKAMEREVLQGIVTEHALRVSTGKTRKRR